VRLFGLDPHRDEVAVKSRLAYVPDLVAFYPWMTVRDTLSISLPSARTGTATSG
jgi:ABC-type multidrug transport system ATPase subunit